MLCVCDSLYTLPFASMRFPPSIIGKSDLEAPQTRRRREARRDCECQVVGRTKFSRPHLTFLRDDLGALLNSTAVDTGSEMSRMVITDDVMSLRIKVDLLQGAHRVVTQMKAVSSSFLRAWHLRINSRAPSIGSSKYLVTSVDVAHEQRRDLSEQQRRG